MLDNSFRKRMTARQDAITTLGNDRGSSRSDVRGPTKLNYCHRLKTTRAQMMAGPLPDGPDSAYVVMEPPCIARLEYEVPYVCISAGRTFRTKAGGDLVGLQQAEYPSCPVCSRGLHYVRTPAWMRSVEVPDGFLVPLPPVHAYVEREL